MKPIKIFDLQFDKTFRDRFYQFSEQIFDEAFLTNHSCVELVENKLKTWHDRAHSIAVNSGSSALIAALMAIDISDREVILPTNTFISCWLAVIQAGGIPVLVDIEPEHLGLDLEQVKEKITAKTKAIMTVHIGGIVSPEIHALQNICKQNGLFLVEDCAHAHGSQYQGQKAGSFGDISCYSFHLTKVMTSGEGGLIVTNSDELASKVISIRQFGKSKENPHVFDQLGGNFKMPELNAAVLLVELERARERILRRQAIAEYYMRHLSQDWQIMKSVNIDECSFYKVISNGRFSRHHVEPFLKSRDIAIPNGVYYTPLHLQPVVRKIQGQAFSFPVAEEFCQRHFCLPCYPELSDAQLERVVLSLNEFENL